MSRVASWLAAAALSAAAGSAEAARVMVFPLEAKGVPEGRAVEATAKIEAGLRGVSGVGVIDPAQVARELGFDVGAEARKCAHDVLCLVQIGEVVEADRLIIGGVQQTLSGLDVVRLSAVDVAKASLVDTVRWEVPRRDGAFDDALQAAGRRMAIPPDATVVFELDPPDAELLLYGAPAPQSPEGGGPIRFWSGVYYGRLSAAGFEPQDVRLTIPPGGPTTLPIALSPDPLWVDGSKPSGGVERIGGEPGDGAASTGPSPFANLIAWGVVAIGAGGIAGGSIMMRNAQGDYNAVSAEPRYTADQTLPWSDAIEARQAAIDDFDLGAKVLYAGIGVAAIGVGWMLIDALLGDGGDEAPRGGAPLGLAF